MHVFARTILTSIPAGPYVLLVDDEAESVRPLCELIRHSGFATVAASSAYDALACSVRKRPIVVVTDLVMPGKDGRDLARRVRRRYPTVPILLVTGQDLDQPAWSVPEGLFHSIFPKPLDFDRFVGTLSDLMGGPRRRGGQRGRA